MNWKDALAQFREGFDEDGYVFIPGFLDELEVQEMQQNLNRFIETIAPTLAREHVFFEDKHQGSTLKQIQQLGVHDAYFGRWQYEGKFRALAQTLLDAPVIPKNMQYFNKPAAIGQPTPPHQDGYYFMLRPCEAVTMWLAIDHVDEENGCVRYVRGSHRLGMRSHGRSGTLGFSQHINDYPCPNDLTHELALSANPGDLLVHHALTIHRADGNRSDNRSRRALGFIYYSEHAAEDSIAAQQYQMRLADELAMAGKI